MLYTTLMVFASDNEPCPYKVPGNAATIRVNLPQQATSHQRGLCVCVPEHVRVRARACACACGCVCMCACARAHVFTFTAQMQPACCQGPAHERDGFCGHPTEIMYVYVRVYSC